MAIEVTIITTGSDDNGGAAADDNDAAAATLASIGADLKAEIATSTGLSEDEFVVEITTVLDEETPAQSSPSVPLDTFAPAVAPTSKTGTKVINAGAQACSSLLAIAAAAATTALLVTRD